MVMGAFVARWTVPTLLKGTGFMFNDLREKPHLIVWALLAGMLWAVGNTLTVFGVRNVGLAIAFPLWNMNSLVGLAWGCLLFKELHGSRCKELGQGSGRRIGDCAWRGGAGHGHGATKCRHARQGGHRHHCRTGRGLHVRHHVHSLPQGLHQRHEPALFRDNFHFRRTGNRHSAHSRSTAAAWRRCWRNCSRREPCCSGRLWAASAG